MKLPRTRTLFLAGATAVGKTQLAIAIAQRIGGEIISVDALQVYRDLDIATAKPSRQERALVPHHLIDVAPLTQRFDTGEFLRLARQAEAAIRSRGKTPIFCGGAGLYFCAYLRGLGSAPATSPELRRTLQRTPIHELLEELRKHDPATYGRIDQRNSRRIQRAVEVLRITGRPLSQQQADWKVPLKLPPDTRFWVLDRGRRQHRMRIDQRSKAMFDSGLLDETRHLLGLGLASNPSAAGAIGYREAIGCLAGQGSLQGARESVARRTWQYARRQKTWFRNQVRASWIPLDDLEQEIQDPARQVKALLERYGPHAQGATDPVDRR